MILRAHPNSFHECVESTIRTHSGKGSAMRTKRTKQFSIRALYALPDHHNYQTIGGRLIFRDTAGGLLFIMQSRLSIGIDLMRGPEHRRQKLAETARLIDPVHRDEIVR